MSKEGAMATREDGSSLEERREALAAAGRAKLERFRNRKKKTAVAETTNDSNGSKENEPPFSSPPRPPDDKLEMVASRSADVCQQGLNGRNGSETTLVPTADAVVSVPQGTNGLGAKAASTSISHQLCTSVGKTNVTANGPRSNLSRALTASGTVRESEPEGRSAAQADEIGSSNVILLSGDKNSTQHRLSENAPSISSPIGSGPKQHLPAASVYKNHQNGTAYSPINQWQAMHNLAVQAQQLTGTCQRHFARMLQARDEFLAAPIRQELKQALLKLQHLLEVIMQLFLDMGEPVVLEDVGEQLSLEKSQTVWALREQVQKLVESQVQAKEEMLKQSELENKKLNVKLEAFKAQLTMLAQTGISTTFPSAELYREQSANRSFSPMDPEERHKMESEIRRLRQVHEEQTLVLGTLRSSLEAALDLRDQAIKAMAESLKRTTKTHEDSSDREYEEQALEKELQNAERAIRDKQQLLSLAVLLIPLPDGWECQIDTSTSKVFYINHDAQKTTWDDPRWSLLQERLASIQQSPLPEPWQQEATEEGERFYINRVSRSTAWEDPRISTEFIPPLRFPPSALSPSHSNSGHLMIPPIGHTGGSTESRSECTTQSAGLKREMQGLKNGEDPSTSITKTDGPGSHQETENSADGETMLEQKESGDSLPTGLEKRRSKNGDYFFVEDNTNTTTWDNPRPLKKQSPRLSQARLVGHDSPAYSTQPTGGEEAKQSIARDEKENETCSEYISATTNYSSQDEPKYIAANSSTQPLSMPPAVPSSADGNAPAPYTPLTYSVVFTDPSSLGIHFQSTLGRGGACVKRVISRSQAAASPIRAGDELWLIDDAEVGTAVFHHVMLLLRGGRRPIRLTFLRPEHPNIFPSPSANDNDSQTRLGRTGEHESQAGLLGWLWSWAWPTTGSASAASDDFSAPISTV